MRRRITAGSMGAASSGTAKTGYRPSEWSNVCALMPFRANSEMTAPMLFCEEAAMDRAVSKTTMSMSSVVLIIASSHHVITMTSREGRCLGVSPIIPNIWRRMFQVVDVRRSAACWVPRMGANANRLCLAKPGGLLLVGNLHSSHVAEVPAVSERCQGPGTLQMKSRARHSPDLEREVHEGVSFR